MKGKLCGLLIAFTLLTGLYSCTKDKTVSPPGVNCTGIVDTNNTYTKNIYPNIIYNGCSGSSCHTDGATNSGVNFTNYATTVASFQSVNVICAVQGTCGVPMPNGRRPLDSLQILELECWQANNYPQ